MRRGPTPVSVAIGDGDGDGDSDLAVANQGGDSVSVLRNRGDGTFAPRMDYGAGSDPSSIAIGCHSPRRRMRSNRSLDSA